MSGQYPHQPAGGAPVTMNNFPGWNQPHHSPAQGHGVSPGNVQSAAPGMSPQPHMQSLTQTSSSSSVPVKYSNMALNGSGSPLPANIINQNPQNSLSDNLRHNFHMFMNQASGQSPKGVAVSSSGSSLSSTKAPSVSADLSRSPRVAERDQNKSVPLAASHAVKDSIMTNQNHGVISGVGISGPFNGDIYPSTSTVSVIANAPSSPSINNPHASGGVIQSNQTEDNLVGVGVTQSVNIKNEPSCGDEIVSGKESANSNPSLEPPSKKLKVENVGSVNSSTVISGSINSGVPSASSTVIQGGSVAPHQSSIPAATTSSKQDALDVESQLEALFAGIADEDKPSKEPKHLPESSSNLQGTPNVVAVLESKGSANKKSKGKSNGVIKTSESGKVSSTESTPKKKRKKKPLKPWDEEDKHKKGKKSSSSKGKYVKEASCDSGSNTSSGRIRGPVVHIEGTKEAPTSHYVVNAPSRQDDEDHDSKKRTSSASRGRKIHIAEGKLSSTGLCGNSLVARYESHSSDPRWVCVFCKKGCHVEGLGDLFGPYLVHHDLELQNSLDFESEMDRKKDKKAKRSGIGQTGVLGLLAIPPLAGEQPQFMVYFHENCAVWSPSINLIGARLAGVQEAVWVAVRSKCSRCLMDGANIGCVRHGCSQQVHYPCARASNWSLDENTFISSCQVHRKPDQVPLLPSAASMG